MKRYKEIPIRSKWAMMEDVIHILSSLHYGQRDKAEGFIDDLKARALYLDEAVQKEVLEFTEQVLFQYDYDPWHKVTPDVTRSADRLFEAMGIVLS